MDVAGGIPFFEAHSCRLLVVFRTRVVCMFFVWGGMQGVLISEKAVYLRRALYIRTFVVMEWGNEFHIQLVLAL